MCQLLITQLYGDIIKIGEDHRNKRTDGNIGQRDHGKDGVIREKHMPVETDQKPVEQMCQRQPDGGSEFKKEEKTENDEIGVDTHKIVDMLPQHHIGTVQFDQQYQKQNMQLHLSLFEVTVEKERTQKRNQHFCPEDMREAHQTGDHSQKKEDHNRREKEPLEHNISIVTAVKPFCQSFQMHVPYFIYLHDTLYKKIISSLLHLDLNSCYHCSIHYIYSL